MDYSKIIKALCTIKHELNWMVWNEKNNVSLSTNKANVLTNAVKQAIKEGSLTEKEVSILLEGLGQVK